MTLIESVSLISSLVSCILGILAIWLALYHKKETDNVNKSTQETLSQVRTDAKTLSQIALPELRAYGESMRKFAFKKVTGSEIESDITNKIEEALNSIRKDVEEIKKKNDVDEIKKELKELTNSTILTGKDLIRNIEVERKEIVIDLTGLGKGIFKLDYQKNIIFQELLDSIYVDLIYDFVPAYTYDQNWVLWDMTKKTSLAGVNRRRTLSELGIMPGNKLEVKIEN